MKLLLLLLLIILLLLWSLFDTYAHTHCAGHGKRPRAAHSAQTSKLERPSAAHSAHKTKFPKTSPTAPNPSTIAQLLEGDDAYG